MAVMHEFPVKYRCEYALQQALSYAIVQSDLAPVFDGSSRCNRAAEQSSLLRLRCGNRVRNIASQRSLLHMSPHAEFARQMQNGTRFTNLVLAHSRLSLLQIRLQLREGKRLRDAIMKKRPKRPRTKRRAMG